MATRNITLSMPDELVRRAKVAAAERDMSVSALVARPLEQVGEVSWTRDDVHER